MMINEMYFRHYLSASRNNSLWFRVHNENKANVVKKVAFLHNVLNDAIAEINEIFSFEVQIEFLIYKNK